MPHFLARRLVVTAHQFSNQVPLRAYFATTQDASSLKIIRSTPGSSRTVVKWDTPVTRVTSPPSAFTAKSRLVSTNVESRLRDTKVKVKSHLSTAEVTAAKSTVNQDTFRLKEKKSPSVYKGHPFPNPTGSGILGATHLDDNVSPVDQTSNLITKVTNRNPSQNMPKRVRNPAPPVGNVPWSDGSTTEVLKYDISALLKDQGPPGSLPDPAPLPERYSEVQLEISALSSSGDGLAVSSDRRHVFAVPFTVPGDKVIAKPYAHLEKERHSLADLVKIVEPSKDRQDKGIRCQYFAKCAGCQFQMMPMAYQLTHKRQVVIKAFQNFSTLDPALIPEVESTLESPLDMGYRTKLTPHFDGPAGPRKRKRDAEPPKFTEVPPIGFSIKGQRKVLDIEDCPIGSPAVRNGLQKARSRVSDNLSTYRNGATLLLRESTERHPASKAQEASEFDAPVVTKLDDGRWEVKECVTDHKRTIKEYVGDRVLTNLANSFFQNNNSILPVFIDYVRERIFPKSEGSKPKFLVDAYCGSGLFTITLSDLFQKSIGIDIDQESIKFASENAKLNNLEPEQTKFIASTASEIFKSIEFPPEETVVVIDPPRKGCDVPFLTQLMKFGPTRIVYVSCNVHTQARDIGILVSGIPDLDGGFGAGKGAYTIESLRGCDFFPQTAHVEGVAILQRKMLEQ